ncbi:E3 ubiquitin-protein ligase RAD18-like [Patiria miniata]|uniref:RING-type E3 ubiquitin transferase n=1 Tax=Patiria miniata TaxID=46514 RepID=A0A914ADC2_PATMI|nr:E3 ubiquitin-protein ligase RAD18-like [Patiria miniata]
MALTDPTDWPGSMPDLRTIDNLLRCSICFEYLNVAMIIPSCSHNYCSLCIRRYMKYKRQCPSCNIEVSASELCNNRTLDELVKTFVAVRPYILKICKTFDAENQEGCPSSDKDLKTSKQQVKSGKSQVFASKQSPKKSTLAGHFTAVKPSKTAPVSNSEPYQAKTSADDFNVLDDDFVSPKLKSPSRTDRHSSNRLGTRPADDRSLVNQINDDVIDITEDFGTERPTASTSSSPAAGQATPIRRQATPRSNQATPSSNQAMPSCSQTTPSGSQTTPSGSQTTPGGSQTTPGGSRDKAECPVCGVPVPTKYINTHLDACLKRTQQTDTNKRIQKRKRIPAMVWKLVPDKEIKKKMRHYNLSIKGKRHELIKRLDEFILMYNAQCDAANPKSAEEIAKEVEKMEQLKTQPPQLKEAKVFKLKIEKGQTEDQMEKSKQEYLSAHKDQFSQLIAVARARMKGVKNKSSKTEAAGPNQTDASQDSNEAETSTSSEDSTASDRPVGSVTENSAVQELEDVMVLEDEVEKQQEDKRIPRDAAQDTSQEDAESDRTGSLFSEGSGGEEAMGNNGESEEMVMDTSESSLHMKQDDADLMASFSGSDVHGQADCRILVPSSPSVASKDGMEDSQSQNMTRAKNETSSVKSDPAPDSLEPLCIPESPLSVVAETRRRKRKKQDCGSNASDSGSSFGDGDNVLRRSKRERKMVK